MSTSANSIDGSQVAGVVVYSRPACGYCVGAKAILARKGVAFTELDVAADRSLLAEMVGRAGGQLSLPQVFIHGRHVGGFAELTALERRGVLDALLAA